MPVIRFLSIALLSTVTCAPALALAAAAPVSASTNGGIASGAPPQAQVDEGNLRDFVAAYEAVSKIRKRLTIKTHGLEDEQKVATLKKQAEKKMKDAILEHLTLGEYVRIGEAVNTNPALHDRFMQMRQTADKPLAPPAATD